MNIGVVKHQLFLCFVTYTRKWCWLLGQIIVCFFQNTSFLCFLVIKCLSKSFELHFIQLHFYYQISWGFLGFLKLPFTSSKKLTKIRLNIGVAKHQSFLCFVTGFCVPLFLSISLFQNLKVCSNVRLYVCPILYTWGIVCL